MPSEPKNLVPGLLKKGRKQICNLVYFYQLQMYIKDPVSNAAKTKSMNLDKLNFALSLKNSTYWTAKVYKIGATKHCCNVSRPVHKVQ